MTLATRAPLVQDALTQEFEIHRYRAAESRALGPAETDRLVVERPLEIRIAQGNSRRRLAVTMRTPGHDLELVTGFLFGEGILRRREDLVDHREGPDWIELSLSADCAAAADLDAAERRFPISASCGVCGKGTVDSVWDQVRHGDWNGPGRGPFVPMDLLLDLPRRLRESQAAFATTGGLHASGLFSLAGEPLCVREDVGRHNALDKIVGHAFLAGRIPLGETVLAVSGRLGFELMQKSAMAGIPIVAAVGAPSSLAIEIAREFDITVAGFVRDGRLNVYHGEWRLTHG